MVGILGFVAPVVVLALLALVAAGVAGVRNGRLTLAAVVHAYAALVLGVCLVLALSGGALLVKALASAALGPDFSYQTVDYPLVAPPPGHCQLNSGRVTCWCSRAWCGAGCSPLRPSPGCR